MLEPSSRVCLQMSDGGVMWMEVKRMMGRFSFKTQAVAGGSRGEETRLCSACCVVESVKKKKKADEEGK